MHGAYTMASITSAYTCKKLYYSSPLYKNVETIFQNTLLFPVEVFRTRYYQEAQEDLYSGPLFLICSALFSLPLSFLSVLAGSRIIFQ